MFNIVCLNGSHKVSSSSGNESSGQVNSSYSVDPRGSTIFYWLQHKSMLLNKHHDATDDIMIEAPNDKAYTRWSCHSGLANPVKIVSTPPAHSKGADYRFLGKPVMRTRWMAGPDPHKSPTLHANKSGFAIYATDKYRLGSRYR